MPAFLRRLRHPFRRPVHYYTIDLNPSPRQLERERQRAEDEIENRKDDEYADLTSSISLPDLPTIVDRGPYPPHIYKNEEFFFNSVMLASDEYPQYVPGPFRRVRQEIRRSPVQGNRRKETDRKPVWDPKQARDERSDDFTVMHAHSPPNPRYVLPPPRVPSPPKEPITPGTREWDTFMDFPSENSRYTYRDDDGNRHVVFPGRELPAMTTSTVSTSLTVIPEAPTPGEHGLAISTIPAQAHPTLARAQVEPIKSRPDSRSTAVEPTEELTWNSALNRILSNEAVDPVAKYAVRERVQRSSTTNGSGHRDTCFVAAAEAGLVPNFSYPIVGSAFYDRVAAEQADQGPGESLPNGVSPGYYGRSSSNDSNLNRPRIRATSQAPEELLPNSISPSYHGSFFSSDFSLHSHPRTPTPPDLTPDHVSSLLCSLLTPSELSLHHHIVLDPIPDILDTSPPSKAASPIPLDARLVQKLHDILYGLQDRIDGLEDDLVPKMSAWLVEKELRVGFLTLSITILEEEIKELRSVVNFGNRVLEGCWEREWENWRTVLLMRQKRDANRSVVSRLLLRTFHSRRIDDEGLIGESLPEGYVPKPSGNGTQEQESTAGSEQQKPLKNKELNALVLMAQQNVRIIKEDVEEMLGKVVECQKRAAVVEQVKPVEGTWRDV
ncbi:hypothetical protein EJ02DRAFT_336767 [Clathrospora elynae]|uniref:Uncharacterized protein n=1 Tax=Clathrospora elynae TaxID=706981 RepID=A0A6A5T298_9PLEO|nr:hypothetical protein EJ02DRAFT_336767 [Clathrospora elynae]